MIELQRLNLCSRVSLPAGKETLNSFFNYVDVYNFTTRKKRDIMVSGITPHKIPNFII